MAGATERLGRAHAERRRADQRVVDRSGCREVVTQLSAANKALERAGFVIVAAGITWCCPTRRAR